MIRPFRYFVIHPSSRFHHAHPLHHRRIPFNAGRCGRLHPQAGPGAGHFGRGRPCADPRRRGGDHLRVPVAAYEPTVYPVLTSTGWNLWGEARRFIRELRPDVLHIQYQSAAYGLHPAVNYLPWRLRALRNRPAIYTTFHDLRFPYIFPKAGPLRWQAVLAMARGSDANVITNPADWSRLVKTGLTQKLRPIPIGSNIECQPPSNYDRASQRAQWGAGQDTWLLGYFGFLNAGKGGETLMRTLAELVRAGRPAQLLMVGGKVGASDPTNQAYLEHVERLTVELGVADRVQWTGFTSSDQVSANLLAVDCAVLPYLEGARCGMAA